MTASIRAIADIGEVDLFFAVLKTVLTDEKYWCVKETSEF